MNNFTDYVLFSLGWHLNVYWCYRLWKYLALTDPDIHPYRLWTIRDRMVTLTISFLFWYIIGVVLIFSWLSRNIAWDKEAKW